MPANKSLGTPRITDMASVQFWMQQVFNHLDAITGHRGQPTFHADVHVQGNRLRGVGTGIDATDAVAKHQLDSSHATLQAQLESTISPEQIDQLHLLLTQETSTAIQAGAFPQGGIVLWHIATPTTPPTGWHLCDGTDGTPVVADYGGLPFIIKL